MIYVALPIRHCIHPVCYVKFPAGSVWWDSNPVPSCLTLFHFRLPSQSSNHISSAKSRCSLPRLKNAIVTHPFRDLSFGGRKSIQISHVSPYRWHMFETNIRKLMWKAADHEGSCSNENWQHIHNILRGTIMIKYSLDLFLGNFTGNHHI